MLDSVNSLKSLVKGHEHYLDQMVRAMQMIAVGLLALPILCPVGNLVRRPARQDALEMDQPG